MQSSSSFTTLKSYESATAPDAQAVNIPHEFLFPGAVTVGLDRHEVVGHCVFDVSRVATFLRILKRFLYIDQSLLNRRHVRALRCDGIGFSCALNYGQREG